MGDRGRVFSSGVRRRSKTLTVGDKRDMGRYPDPKLAYLPGLRTGMTMDCFHMEGIVALLYDRLYRLYLPNIFSLCQLIQKCTIILVHSGGILWK